MYKYGNLQTIKVPGPEALLEVQNPSDASQKCQIVGVLDTGAKMTVIPEDAIASIGNLVSSTVIVREASGNMLSAKKYFVNLTIDEYKFNEVEVVALPRNYAIIGRDILNNLKIILDGPNLTWQIENRRN